MTGRSAPAVVAVRTAIRDSLRTARDHGELRDGDLLLVGCSGGPDSVALAAGAAWVAPRLGLRAGAVVVDHGLQDGSERVAAVAADACASLGLSPVEVVRVNVPTGPGGDGPEARARAARHGAFRDVAARTGASAVLLAHTRDDQAETVLLGLARGSGARALSGMAPDAPLPGSPARLLRPLLRMDRATVRAAAVESGQPVWEDPHNTDPAYARARVRHRALPSLVAALGPGVSAALARSADLLRADADALDQWSDRAHAEVRSAPGPGAVDLDVAGLAALPAAVRTRVLMRAVLDVGVPAKRLTSGHLLAVDALVARWHGQGEVRLPGGITASRGCGRLRLAAERPDPVA